MHSREYVFLGGFKITFPPPDSRLQWLQGWVLCALGPFPVQNNLERPKQRTPVRYNLERPKQRTQGVVEILTSGVYFNLEWAWKLRIYVGIVQNNQIRSDNILGGGPERANDFAHLRAAPAYSALQMTRAGTRLSIDLESQENSNLTDIIKRMPARVFFTFLMVSVPRHFFILASAT